MKRLHFRFERQAGWPQRVLIAAVTVFLLASQVWAQSQTHHTIRVVDSVTGRGVPLVQLKAEGNTFFTDSNGIVALDHQALINRDQAFEFASYGYTSIAQTLSTQLGNQSQISIVRNNRAERLYRSTGANIYAASVAVGQSTPINEPISNANIMGQDSVQWAVYNNRIHWFWGDSLYENGGGLGGNYWTSGATSELPANGGLVPSQGVDYTYYEDELGQTRPMFPLYKSSGRPVWVDGAFTADDNSGRERLLVHFMHVDSFLPQFKLREQGLAVFSDAAEAFVKLEDYGVAPVEQWGTGPPITPKGHSFRHSTGGVDYIYFGENYPNIRVRDNWDDIRDIATWEAFTPLRENSRYNAANPPLELDNEGKPVYGWKKNTDPLGTEIFEEMVTNGHLSRAAAPVGLIDHETNSPVRLHRSSVSWNDYRQKWVMIGNQSFGNGSFLGEVWYAEAPTPEGPWKNAIKIATHADPTGELGGSYSFYNPTQLPFFDEQGGRYIHFQGTYSSQLFDSAPNTPDYEYNQIAYRLDLATLPQLAANVPAADFNADGLVDRFDLATWLASFGTDAQGDANDNGITDGTDFLLLQLDYGRDLSVALQTAAYLAVPEPSTSALMLITTAATIASRVVAR